MVIVEIMRDYPHFDRILGEHHWSEFLQKPTKEEKDRVTQVFYCTYNTGRLVQKHGGWRVFQMRREPVAVGGSIWICFSGCTLMDPLRLTVSALVLMFFSRLEAYRRGRGLVQSLVTEKQVCMPRLLINPT